MDASSVDIEAAISAVIAAGRRAAARGWVPATSGNFSVRAGEMIAITRTGCDKGELTPDDVAVVPLSSPFEKGLSAEAALHFARYAADAGLGAVFHAHMPLAALLGRRHARQGQLIFQGWELQKGFAGVGSHLASVRVPIVANDQDMRTLAGAAEAELQRASDHLIAPGYLIAGHGIYAWGNTAKDAQRHLETFAGLFELYAQWPEAAS
jgi:methylthioribulose-1-phosphate dehydratase